MRRLLRSEPANNAGLPEGEEAVPDGGAARSKIVPVP